MKIPLFKPGNVVRHKSDSPHKIVILKVRKRLFNWQQTYTVCWYDGGIYHSSSAFECELEKMD